MNLYLVRLVYTASDGIQIYHPFKVFSDRDSAMFWLRGQMSKMNIHWRSQIATLSGVKFEDVKL